MKRRSFHGKYRHSANRKFEIISTLDRVRVLENCFSEFRIARAFCKPADEGSRLSSIFFSVCLPKEEEASSSVRSWLVSCGQLLAFLLLDHEQGDPVSEQELLLLLAALEDCAADHVSCL